MALTPARHNDVTPWEPAAHWGVWAGWGEAAGGGVVGQQLAGRRPLSARGAGARGAGREKCHPGDDWALTDGGVGTGRGADFTALTTDDAVSLTSSLSHQCGHLATCPALPTRADCPMTIV